jgi:UDP:flavonoid glycosyltransferase YjiC (YdhE family)
MADPLEPWTPSTALRAFLGEGAPPVLVSLGSMEHMAPERARDLLIAAAREAKVRAILQTKRDGAEGRDGDLYFLPWAPHRRLLGACSVAVHHGGAGTTHAVLRAGRPAVVVPFIFEQKLWANRLAQLGAAPAFVSFWKATPGKLASRISEAMESEAMRARSSELARAMAAEDGTGRATRLLEELLSPTPGS